MAITFKTIIIYHQARPGIDCPDGIMAAAVAKMKYVSAELRGDSYRNAAEYEAEPPIDAYPYGRGYRLVIVDFSYPAHWLRYWEEKGVEVIVIDHHASKFPMLAGFTGAVLDEEECGATLAWKKFFPDWRLPKLLVHVRNRDIGDNDYYEGGAQDSHAINEGLSKLRSENKQDGLVSLLIHLLDWDKACDFLRAKGQPLIDQRNKLIDEAIEQCEVYQEGILLGDEMHWYVKIHLQEKYDRYTSLIGNKLARTHDDMSFAWVVTSEGTNSLRSTRESGFDVSEIATKYGGGGHKHAAGFKWGSEEEKDKALSK